jgi:hypothetical protein
MGAALRGNLQRVVVGDLSGLNLVDLGKEGIGTRRRNAGCSRYSELTGVDVPQIVKMDATGSYISELENGCEGNLLLDGRVPLLTVGRLRIWILGEGRCVGT